MSSWDNGAALAISSAAKEEEEEEEEGGGEKVRERKVKPGEKV